MNLPIRDQILWPLVGLLLIAVAANAAFSTWWLSVRNLDAMKARQRQIIGVLEESSFPLSDNVMQKLKRLTGDEFLVWDSGQQQILASTLSEPEQFVRELQRKLPSFTAPNQESLNLHHQGFLIRVEPLRGTVSRSLVLLTSDQSLKTLRREASWPPIAVGCATIMLLIPLTLMLVSGIASRIRSVEKHVKSIAQGQFGLELPAGKLNDELNRLVMSINSMSRQLSALRQELVQVERTRLVAQLAAGFAHQLRNGLAGTRLAIQLHESRCPNTNDGSLAVANNQLALVEEEVHGLLSLGKSETKPQTEIELTALIDRIQQLVLISCQHRGITLNVDISSAPVRIVGLVDGLKAAILNLVLNAIDAVDTGGSVWITLIANSTTVVIRVEDNGDGPPVELQESLFNPFVTSKPEGIGLGLTVALTVAQAHQGSLIFQRVNDRTRFELNLPRDLENPASTQHIHTTS